MRRALASILMSILCGVVCAQEFKSFAVVYYDVDRLYDAQPSEFYDDSDYTPAGRLRWSEERYAAKISNVAQVVDSLSMPVVVLYGVENENVVRDIVSRCTKDYAYQYCSSSSRDGLDFAMLYFGDRFFPERVTPWRGAMCVEGWAGDMPLTIIANQRSASIGVLLEELDLLREGSNVVVVGRPNKLNFSELGLRDATLRAEKAGRGNCIVAGRWQMRDRVATNVDAECRCDVYIKSWLLNSSGEPLPTYDRRKYYGGYANYLPVFIYFPEILAY